MKSIRLIALSLTALAATGVAATASSPTPPPPRVNWAGTVVVTEDGSHIQGNPQAPVKLTEFVSYTCSHCANFEKQADAPLRLGYVSQGKVSVEVRHLLRDPVDMTAALLTNCGASSRFFGNHTMFMVNQDRWMARLEKLGPSTRQRWGQGEFGTRMRSVATDLGFYDMMASRGYSRQTIDACLADQGKAQKLAAMTQDAMDRGIQGTPSFQINGNLSSNHEWRGLETEIRALLR